MAIVSHIHLGNNDNKLDSGNSIIVSFLVVVAIAIVVCGSGCGSGVDSANHRYVHFGTPPGTATTTTAVIAYRNYHSNHNCNKIGYC